MLTCDRNSFLLAGASDYQQLIRHHLQEVPPFTYGFLEVDLSFLIKFEHGRPGGGGEGMLG